MAVPLPRMPAAATVHVVDDDALFRDSVARMLTASGYHTAIYESADDFLTKRPQTAGSTAQVQTQRWLESKGFPLPSVFVVQGSRGRIAASLDLDIVVDDRPENALDVVVDSKARALLIWREDETRLPGAAKRLGIGVIRSVGECLDILSQVDSAGPQQPGVLDRVMLTSVLLAVVAFGVWFFAFAGSSLPS